MNFSPSNPADAGDRVHVPSDDARMPLGTILLIIDATSRSRIVGPYGRKILLTN